MVLLTHFFQASIKESATNFAGIVNTNISGTIGSSSIDL